MTDEEAKAWIKDIGLEHGGCSFCGRLYGHHRTKICAKCEECSTCCHCKVADYKTLVEWIPILLSRL